MENEKIVLSDGRIIYDSRSNACATFLYKHTKDNKIFLFIIKRGSAVEETDKWSIPCGYLDRDETLKECAIREFYEETGYKINDSEETPLKLTHIDDNPKGNERQNITFCYVMHIFEGKKYNSKEINKLLIDDISKPLIDTKNEVTEIQWISMDDLSSKEWAYNANNVSKILLDKSLQNGNIKSK